MASASDGFLCGVIEGFYGFPWSFEQRKDLFTCMLQFGLGIYVYAPKDDAKHRARWRELYTEQECETLADLIHEAQSYSVEFVYALSPGLDIAYSCSRDMHCIKSKLEQVASLGCCSFALFFDDIPSGLSAEDEIAFDSFAHAQASVTNALFSHLMPRRLLFCPTEYCASRAVPSVQESVYLRTLGAELNPLIGVFWTGPDVVSREIPVADIRAVTATLGRKPVIWDNIHANDYEQHSRVFLGAYDGRAPDLRALAAGVLSNPNCEYTANYVPLHTLGAWVRLGGAYDAETAQAAAIDDWLFACQGRPSPKPIGSPSPDTRRTPRIADADMHALVRMFPLPWLPSEPFAALARDARDIVTGRGSTPRRAAVLARCHQVRATIDRLRRALPRSLGDDLRAYLWNAAEACRVLECAAECPDPPPDPPASPTSSTSSHFHPNLGLPEGTSFVDVFMRMAHIDPPLARHMLAIADMTRPAALSKSLSSP